MTTGNSVARLVWQNVEQGCYNHVDNGYSSGDIYRVGFDVRLAIFSGIGIVIRDAVWT